MSRKPAVPKKTAEEYAAERRQRFLNGASDRVNKALHRIARVGAMGNQVTWTYTEAEAEAVIAALESAVKDARKRFFGKAEAAGGFVLPQ